MESPSSQRFFFYEASPSQRKIYSCVALRKSDGDDPEYETVLSRKPLKVLRGKVLLYSSTDVDLKRWIPLADVMKHVEARERGIVNADALISSRDAGGRRDRRRPEEDEVDSGKGGGGGGGRGSGSSDEASTSSAMWMTSSSFGDEDVESRTFARRRKASSLTFLGVTLLLSSFLLVSYASAMLAVRFLWDHPPRWAAYFDPVSNWHRDDDTARVSMTDSVRSSYSYIASILESGLDSVASRVRAAVRA